MFSRSGSNYSYWLLSAAAYVTLIFVALSTLSSAAGTDLRGMLLGGYVLFGLLLAFFPRLEGHPRLVHGYMLLQTLVVATLMFWFPSTSGNTQTLFFVLSAQSMLFLPTLPALAWIFLFTVLTLGGYAYYEGSALHPGVYTVIGGYLFFGTFGAALRQANEARQESQRLLVELRAANAQLRAYTQQAQQLAVAEERNRLAREMHDALGHRLTVAVVQLEGARRLIPQDPQRAATIVETMRAQLKAALAELRHTISTLRQPADQDVPADLATAVSQLSYTFSQATGLTVHLDLPEALPPLPEAVQHALFRAAQESLTNVQRHANAQTAWLTLTTQNGQITLTTDDDGQGFPAETGDGRFGLQGLRERAGNLNGAITLGRSPQGGAQICITLPLPSENHHG